MESSNITVLAVILGSVLGFVATLTSSLIVGYLDNRRKAIAHKTYLKLEFGDFLKSIEEIRTAFEYQRFYDFLLLDLLDKNVENLQEVRKNTWLITDPKLQVQVFEFINRIALLAKEMRGIQSYAYRSTIQDETTGQDRPMTAPEKTNRNMLVEQKRQSHMLEILDLKREIKKLEELL